MCCGGVAFAPGTARSGGFSTATGSASKKTAFASEQDRPDVAAARERWRRRQGGFDPRRLVFIDETWAKTNMARRYGRCRRGVRLVGRVPHGHWKTTTFVAGLRRDGITAPFVIDRPMNGVIFCTYVERVLAPTLRPGDVVILDNLGSHRGPRSAASSRHAARTFSSCRLTSRTLTPSSSPSPSSRHSSERQENGRSTTSGHGSASASTPSPQTNAKTTSSTRDMRQTKRCLV